MVVLDEGRRAAAVLLARVAGLSLTVGLLLSACVSEPETPLFYKDLGQVNAQVDVKTAAQMISNYRANNGLAPIQPDQALMALAAAQAQAMADAGNVDASLKDGYRLPDLLARIGESNTHARSNVSGGYRTLAEAFSGWRESPKHNAVMLDADARRFGLATAYAPNAKHKVFWSLIMAGPVGQGSQPVSVTGRLVPAPTPKTR